MKPHKLIPLLIIIAASNVIKAEVEPITIPYAEDIHPRLKMDIYQPENIQESAPVIFWIHGGGWSGGGKRDVKILDVVGKGYAVVSANYRLSQHAKFPAQIDDLRLALRFLLEIAPEYNLDKNKIFIVGESAGGQLAVLLGVTLDQLFSDDEMESSNEAEFTVRGIVNYYGASDFVLRSITQPHRANEKGSVVYNYLGGPANELTEKAVMASPALHVSPDDPPLLIFHGVKDNTVLIDQSQRLFQAYLDRDLNVEFHALDRLGHGGKDFYQGLNFELLLKFLAQNLEN